MRQKNQANIDTNNALLAKDIILVWSTDMKFDRHIFICVLFQDTSTMQPLFSR